jgi:hypothetical protein
METQKIVEFNLDQYDHVATFQRLIFDYFSAVFRNALTHDRSKLTDKEYLAFVGSRDSLRKSETGADEAYQKHLNSEAIQHHIHSNPHHPEYWDEQGFDTMPVDAAIQMYFDWKSRCIQKGNTMDGFWQYNLNKLSKQPTAKAIVIKLRQDLLD